MQGLESVMNNGIVAGFPIIGVKAVLLDGAYHEVDSSVLAFEIAARQAFKQGLRKANARLMEPIMKVRNSVVLFFSIPVILFLSLSWICTLTDSLTNLDAHQMKGVQEVTWSSRLSFSLTHISHS